jgi:hypothetical protein
VKLVYPGPFDQVELPSLGVTAPKGEPVEVPDPHAASLLEQGWLKPKIRQAKEQNP